MTSREIVEAILFLPAMALLALVIGTGMYAIIVAGGWILRAYFWIGADLLALPRSLALALAVILAAFTVGGLGTLVFEGRRRRTRRMRLKA